MNYKIYVQNVRHPVGVTENPLPVRWEITDGGVLQTAWQLQVSDRQGKVCYDSGKTQDASTGHAIPAEFMESSREYFLRLRVWNETEKDLGWSNPVRVITGILEEKFPAPFITAAGKNMDIYTDTLCYQTQTVLRKPELALIHVACIGQHELFLNGEKVGNRLMAPSRTKIQKDSSQFAEEHETEKTRVRYITYDVTEQIKQGSNTISCWTDAGWARSCKILPAIAIWGVFLEENEIKTVSTDEKEWKFAKMKARHIGGYRWGDFGGEEICTGTAGNRLPDENLEWMPVRECACSSIVSADLLESGDYVLQRLSPVSVTREEDSWCVDMGEPFTGFLSFEIPGLQMGQKIVLTAADKATEPVTFHQESHFLVDSPEARCCNRFNYMCGRYFHIYGAEKKPENICGLVIGNRMEKTLHFESSSTFLNDMAAADLRTYRANTVNGITSDCPHRERLGYGEAAIYTGWGVGSQAFDSREFYIHMFENWADRQQACGFIPRVAPDFDGGGGTTWSSALMILMHDFYLQHRDRVLLEKYYPVLSKWATFLSNQVEGGLLTRYAQERINFRFLGDWAYAEGDDWGFTPNALFFNNCVCLYNFRIITFFAKELGKEGDAKKFAMACDGMQEEIHRKYYNPAIGAYRKGEQRYQAVALCAEVPQGEDLKNVVKSFEKSLREKQYLDGGSAGLPFILRAALKYLKTPELIYQILNRKAYPGYGYFLEQGCQTWPEMWDISMRYGGSRVHTCYTGILGYLIRGIGGVMPDEAQGAGRLQIRPWFPEDLEHLNLELNYGYGKVRMGWKRISGAEYSVQLTVPFNGSVCFHAPEGWQMEDGSREKELSCGSFCLTLRPGNPIL